ncbi:hypothetical protein VL15_14310 [Burkholderia cepacia]|uniref:Uncharacterized protein n=1 Tax=Burkholderia cepacia TaxID=292 RepID=A0A0J5WZA5_BURCE|nr:hypothetical protein VL15_14310 [Burkholderia cepacia]
MRTLARLVVNAGSSTMKFAVFAFPPHDDPAQRPPHEGDAGARTTLLGGRDMLVFTAGIGEHAAALRERIYSSLGWLGIDLDLFTCSESAADIRRAIGCRYARRRAKRSVRRIASPKPRAV